MFVFASPILYGVNVVYQSIIAMIPDLYSDIFNDPSIMTWYLRGIPNVITRVCYRSVTSWVAGGR